jgi:hypothetical protein
MQLFGYSAQPYFVMPLFPLCGHCKLGPSKQRNTDQGGGEKVQYRVPKCDITGARKSSVNNAVSGVHEYVGKCIGSCANVLYAQFCVHDVPTLVLFTLSILILVSDNQAKINGSRMTYPRQSHPGHGWL